MESVSPAEQILVERSQDSVQVTKNRLHRQSLTNRKSDDEEDPDDHIAIDPRQDSLAHAHRRLGHTTAAEGAMPASKHRKKPKTRFSTDSESDSLGLDEGTRAERQERKKSIGRRISEALHFKKMGAQTPPSATQPSAAIEESPPSVHVKFSKQSQVID